MWRCVCDCGNEVIISKSNLLSGHTQSCGCMRKDAAVKTKTTHGESNTLFYDRWSHIIIRCSSNLKHYGKKGICVCTRWKKYTNFKEDMYTSFCAHVKKHGLQETSIDRIDSNGNYCKSNCRWATRKEQNRNTSQNRFLEFNGEKHTVAEWAEILGIKHTTIRSRLSRGATDTEALGRY